MNRRTAVEVLGGLAFGTVAAAWGRRAFAQPVCTLTPEQIEGPFYLDQARMREAIPEEVTNAVYARAPYDRHPNRDTTNTTDRFLGSIADKSLVMWTMARDGDGYIADATVAFRTS